MLKAHTLGNSIRVLRSHSLPAGNMYRPEKGIRYDGLYRIVNYEIIEERTAMHRFTLRREPGQTPIRYQGPGKRPTAEELVQYEKACEMGLQK